MPKKSKPWRKSNRKNLSSKAEQYQKWQNRYIQELRDEKITPTELSSKIERLRFLYPIWWGAYKSETTTTRKKS